MTRQKTGSREHESGVRRLIVFLSLLMALAVTLTACGGGEEAPVPTQGPPTATPPPTPAPSLGDVVWTTQLADDGSPAESLSEIPRDTIQIVAAIEVRQLLPESTFTVSWSMDGTPLESLGSMVELSEGSTEGWLTATLTWNGATLWPVGVLGITFVANSGESVTGSVQIISG